MELECTDHLLKKSIKREAEEENGGSSFVGVQVIRWKTSDHQWLVKCQWNLMEVITILCSVNVEWLSLSLRWSKVLRATTTLSLSHLRAFVCTQMYKILCWGSISFKLALNKLYGVRLIKAIKHLQEWKTQCVYLLLHFQCAKIPLRYMVPPEHTQ